MLQLSPELMEMLRAVQSATEERLRLAGAAARQKRSVHRLNQARRNHLIDRTAKILRTGEASKFEFEASCRHGLRSSLCLQGWTWADADLIAAEIVAAALNRIGAERPTWKEGQPEWTQDGVLRVERENCIRCRGPLPEGHYKYCSSMCGSADRSDIARRTDADAENAKIRAYRATWSTKQSDQACEACGDMFRPKSPGARFCSIRCRNIRNSGLRYELMRGRSKGSAA